MKIDLKRKPRTKGVLEFMGIDIQRKMVELEQIGETQQEWGIPVSFVDWRGEGKGKDTKIFHKLNFSGKQLVRTVEERDILLDSVKKALDSDDLSEIKKILLDAEDHIVWSFIERGYYFDPERSPETRRVLNKYGQSNEEDE